MRISKDNNSVNVRVARRKARRTPKKGNRFYDVVKTTGKVVSSGLSIAGGLVSSPLVSIATGGINAAANSSSGGTNFGNVKTVQDQSQQFNVDFLKLQMEIQAENRRFTTQSNIQKARHDTAKAAINNIRT
jgi:hypothetical protein